MGKHSFHTGMCDCCAPPGGAGRCMYVLCCPYCAAGDVASKVGGSFCPDCCLPCMFPFISSCLWSSTRQIMKAKYDIRDGDCCTDCLLHWLCPACMLCQTLNEIDHRDSEARAAAPARPQVVFIQQSAPPQQQNMQGVVPQQAFGMPMPMPMSGFPGSGAGYPAPYPAPYPYPYPGSAPAPGYAVTYGVPTSSSASPSDPSAGYSAPAPATGYGVPPPSSSITYA